MNDHSYKIVSDETLAMVAAISRVSDELKRIADVVEGLMNDRKPPTGS